MIQFFSPNQMRRQFSKVFLFSCLLILSLNGFSQIDEPRVFNIASPIRGMSNYGWKIYLMTDDGAYYWHQKLPDMGAGAYAVSPLGNHFYLINEDAELLKFSTHEFELEKSFRLKLKEEKFLKLFFEGDGQELYGLTTLGRMIRIEPGAGDQTLKPVFKNQVGTRTVWNPNLAKFLIAKGKQLQYSRLNGKPPTPPIYLDRAITALQMEAPRYEVLAGLDNGKVVAMEQDLKLKKWTIPIGQHAITSVQYHPKDHYVFAGDATGKIHIYDLKKKRSILSRKVHNGAVDLRILYNAQGNPDMVTVGMDKQIKAWGLSKLPPDYHRIVREVLLVKEERYLKQKPAESQATYEQRTSAARVSSYLAEEREWIVDSLAFSLKQSEKAAIAMKGDSVSVEVKPFPVLTFHPGRKVTSLSGARLDSVRFMLRDDNDFMPRQLRITTVSGDLIRYDQDTPAAVQDLVEVPLELARKVAREELVIKEELSELVTNLRNKGELNNVELGMEASLKNERDSLGRNELNLHVTYIYRGTKAQVSGVSADYLSGRYRLSDSKAGTTLVDFMLRTVNEQLSKYLIPGQIVTFRLTGSTDKTPVSSKLPYSNEFGPFENYPYYFQGMLAGLDVTSATGITTNSQLGFMRTYAVRDYLEKQQVAFTNTSNHFVHFSEEADGYGPEYRKIKIEIIFHNIDRKVEVRKG